MTTYTCCINDNDLMEVGPSNMVTPDGRAVKFLMTEDTDSVYLTEVDVRRLRDQLNEFLAESADLPVGTVRVGAGLTEAQWTGLSEDDIRECARNCHQAEMSLMNAFGWVLSEEGDALWRTVRDRLADLSGSFNAKANEVAAARTTTEPAKASEVPTTFKIGDVVQHRSGGPRLTVCLVTGESVSVRWFEGGSVGQGVFPATTLRAAVP
jgi:uncharacterized protein YodC (DUF2158 family)